MKQQQARVYYQVGNDFLKKRDYLKAISSYKNAIRLDPKYFKAYCNLGVAYKNAGLFSWAEEIYKKALHLKPDSGVIFNNLGNVFTVMNRFEEAKICYLKAIQIYPEYQEALYNLGQVYYFSGEKEKAYDLRIKLEKVKSKSRQQKLKPRLK